MGIYETLFNIVGSQIQYKYLSKHRIFLKSDIRSLREYYRGDGGRIEGEPDEGDQVALHLLPLQLQEVAGS
jgi:hypothetical protein